MYNISNTFPLTHEYLKVIIKEIAYVKIEFYETASGRSDTYDYLEGLERKARRNKKDKILFQKIVEYMRLLQTIGTAVGFPYVRYLSDDIWELRPNANRFFFFFEKKGAKYVMLHYFVKQRQKTPLNELETAKKHMLDYLERMR